MNLKRIVQLVGAVVVSMSIATVVLVLVELSGINLVRLAE